MAVAGFFPRSAAVIDLRYMSWNALALPLAAGRGARATKRDGYKSSRERGNSYGNIPSI
jgi:hypothetical protein